MCLDNIVFFSNGFVVLLKEIVFFGLFIVNLMVFFDFLSLVLKFFVFENGYILLVKGEDFVNNESFVSFNFVYFFIIILDVFM